MADREHGFRIIILVCQLIGIFCTGIMGYCAYFEVHLVLGLIAGLIAAVSFMAVGMMPVNEKDERDGG